MSNRPADIAPAFQPLPRPAAVPARFVKETLDGVRAYYRGYREVLAKTKTFEEIMGCSSLQWGLLEAFVRLLSRVTDVTRFALATNEAGVHLSKKNNLSVDLALFDRQVFRPEMVSKKYVNVPPVLSIEVDVDVEFDGSESDMTVPKFILQKTKNLHDFGVQKIIWVLSEDRTVLVSEQGRAVQYFDWNEDIEVWEGHRLNIGAYLRALNIHV